ncbi:AsmA family protein [Luteimonas sp. MC1750]|uniref:AsmA family protein n=1 Tax=Luteimonas sp. MC1750 TaxID=2799326 RepID=UPI0018F077B4|nr:AsmA family protein [Luteimonas sp. MC1750]MBJ6983544.1 AsmA family protein [Luteimonas sp. MC1750]QQO06391.1 AsmA family protein [Luteimonas sp. MC1750]
MPTESTSQGATHSRPVEAVLAHPWRTVAVVVAAGLLALLLLWDWNWFRGPVERIVSARTGRSFDIGGDLDVDVGRTAVIRADRLTLGNADWSDSPDMATTDRLELHVRLWPLLAGQVHIPELRLRQPDILLEAGEDGGNWRFDGMSGEGEGPRIDLLHVESGRLRYVDAARETDVDLGVASEDTEDPSVRPLALSGDGHWRGAPFELTGAVASPLALRETETPYAIDLRASAGATRAHARGAITRLLGLSAFDLQMALSGKDLEDLYPLLGIAMPHTPPYELDGRLVRDDAVWRYEGFSGKVGDSDLGGTAKITTGRERLLFEGDLHSKLLDFDDLAGFVGGAPDSGAGETGNAELEAEAAKRAAAGRLLPDTPYDLHKLRNMDADVRWKAARIEAPGWPLDDMDVRILLEAGLLRLDPLEFGAAGGRIRSTVRMDARQDAIQTDAAIRARGLELGRLLPDNELAQGAVGRVSGDIDLSGTGNSVARMLATADGDATLGMGRGQVSNLLLELAGLDIYEALKFLIGKDRQVAVRCAFGDFAVQDGVMTTRALAFDTEDTIIIGEGTIDLGEEQLDLLLKPRPKDRSILALRSPLVIDGSFRDPGFRPDMARLGLRGAIALALGSIAPPAALLATLELGPGEDSTCGGQYAK